MGQQYDGTQNGCLTTEDVRVYIKDAASSNTLLADQEFSDDRIRLAMEMALDDFNNIPVQTQFTLDYFPSKTILMLGTVAQLLKGEKLFQARNNLSYQDAGIAVNDRDKANIYAELGNQFYQEFEQRSRQWKREWNLQQGWGNFGSEYHGFYRTR